MWHHYDLMQRLQGLPFHNLTALDLGCGSYSSEVAKQVLDIPWLYLEGVDGYEPDLEKAKTKECKAQKHSLAVGDVKEVASAYALHSKFDVVLSFDVLEHLTKEDGLKFLADIDKIAKNTTVLFLPIEPEDFHRASPDPANVLQEHLSHWQPVELKRLGYDVEVVNDVHTEKTQEGKNITFGAMWCTKKYE